MQTIGMKNKTVSNHTISIQIDQVYSAVESWLKAIKVIRDDQIIEAIKNFPVRQDGKVDIILGREEL